MGQKVDLRLAALLDEAETRTSCLVPANDADRKALDRRKPAEVICPRPGLYARRAKWELLKRHPDIRALMVVRGLATQHPDWVFAHVSAALAHGLQVSGRSLGKIHLATNQTAHTESSGQIVRHCVPDEELAECVSVGGVRVTSLLRTAFDCMRSLPADEALVVADSLLRKTGRTAWWLCSRLRRHHQLRRPDPARHPGGPQPVRQPPSCARRRHADPADLGQEVWRVPVPRLCPCRVP